MSKDEAVKRANAETPADVEVPSSWAGLALWAVGKWGLGAPIAVALVLVYQDLRVESAYKGEMIRAITEVQAANVRAIEAIAAEVKDLSRELRERPKQ